MDEIKKLLTKYANRKHGMLFIVGSIFLTIIMLIALEWDQRLSFIQNLGDGYIFWVTDFYDDCESLDRAERLKRMFDPNFNCHNLYFYFKYMVLIPIVGFMYGLYGVLSESESQNA